MKYIKIAILIALSIVFTTCDNFFEFSVYEADVKPEKRNTTSKNLELIQNLTLNSDSFKFAFISDSHYFYDGLKKVIEDINKNDQILFVLFGGDITEQALIKEYDIFYDIMLTLKKPYITVIGNHDYNSNGDLIYTRMFGDFNYSFEFNNNKFILFDDIVWESKKKPDFNWLSNQLQNTDTFNQVFVISHIPPLGDQFTTEMTNTYRKIMSDNKVPLSLNGHTHSFEYKQGPVSYLTVPALKEEAYGVISVGTKSFNVELIEL